MYNQWLLSLTLMIVAVCLVGLLTAVASSQRRTAMHYSFSIFLLAAAVWVTGLAIFLSATTAGMAGLAAAIYYSAAAWVAYAFLLLGLTVPRSRHHQKSPSLKMISLLALPIVGLMAIAIVPGTLVSQVQVGVINSVSLHPIGYGAYTAVFLVYLALASWLLFKKITTAKDRHHRRQLSYIAGSAAFGMCFGAFFNLILPLFNNYYLIWVGPLCGIPVVVIVFYAIMRHSLFDIRSAVIRSVTYSMVLLSMTVFYFGVAFLLSGLFQKSLSSTFDLLVNIGIAITLALLFQPLKRFFDRLTDRVFYRDNYDTDDFHARFSSELGKSGDMRRLLKAAADVLKQTFKAERSFIWVRYGDDHHMVSGSRPISNIAQADLKLLDDHVERHGDGIIVETLLDEESVQLEKFMERHSLAIVLPLTQNEEIIGYLFLGERRSREYSRRDLRVLETVADELAIAVQNSISLQDVKDINATLEQRIEAATKELRASNKELQRLDSAKDEFVSMASHQLRTPLTSVKGYISMVLEGDAGKLSPMQQKLLEEAFTSSERMVHLINDFLNVSRLQTGKFMIDLRQVDLVKVARQEVDGLQTTANAHDLKLRFRSKVPALVLQLDENKIRQVMMNFIDNAIYYSPRGSTITVEIAVVDGSATLEVHDKGMGVPDSEQARLFTKFYRASNARKQRPDGTGVGLFLAKKVVDSHGGSLIFESKVGKGSTFGFRLPIKQLTLDKKTD